MKTKILYFLLCIGLSSAAFGQTQRAFLEAAHKSELEADYYNALYYYQEAFEFDSTNVDIAYSVAENARKFNAYNLAEEFYEKVTVLDDNNKHPEALFYKANMQQRQGKYEDAESSLQSYLTEFEGEDEYLTSRATKELEAVIWAKGLEDTPREDLIVTKLGGDINTEKSEFGALVHDGQLVYSSLRFSDSLSNNFPSRTISKLLSSNDFTSSYELESPWNQSGKFVAHTAFNHDKSWVYFTICSYVDGANIRCDIYRSTVGPTGYGNAQMLPESINNPTSTNTQPSLGYDPTTNKEILYFASDRDGGEGGLDIYAATLDGDYFGDVLNLDKINTSENDVSPFFHNGTQMLYFSSEGHRGLGGFDIYKIRYQANQFAEDVIHLGIPVNSSYNDVYYWLDDEGEKAYFSSNKVESAYIDDVVKACCYDIYESEFVDLDFYLNAQTFHKRTLDSLYATTVRLVDKFTGEEIASITSGAASVDHLFKLQSDREYLVIGEKQGFTSDTIPLSTLGLYVSDTLVKKLFLDPNEVELELQIFDSETLENLNGATVTIIDLLDGETQDIVVTNDNSNIFNFTLQPGRKYKVIISKEGYETQSFEVDTDRDFPSGKLTQKVFLKKKDLNVFLPTFLYFDNDRPNPKSLATTTNLLYSETYGPYMARRPYFVKRAGASLSEEMKQLEKQRMDDFFEYDVKGGFIRLNMFLNALSQKLDEGYQYEILIKGFASPIASDKYNKALSKRRIASVINELKKFENAKLMPYMQSGKLLVTDVSYGEELAPENVSDSRRRLSESIFSVEASRERRIEIIKVRNSFYKKLN